MDLRGLVWAAWIAAAVVWSVGLPGCSKKLTIEPISETSDTLPITHGAFTNARDGKTYKTVTIGGETWMAENLNYQTNGSWCYEDSNSHCDKYGRLYAWNAAKTACPTGWHLPSRLEWKDLITIAGGRDIAGKTLKSASGWDWGTYENASGNGTDDYGFSALPGGVRTDDGRYVGRGHSGNWWMAAKDRRGGAYHINAYSGGGHVNANGLDTNEGHSVRCVRDGSGKPPGSARRKNLDEKQKEEERRIERLSDYFIDQRDGRQYRAVKVGGRTWMAENLNYEIPDGAWCYDDNDFNCDKYGMLYTWKAAMAACPDGWHLPSAQEWDGLALAAGGEGIHDRQGVLQWRGAGGKLKAKSGWNGYGGGKDGNGTDDYGFSALPGGGRNNSYGIPGGFLSAGEYGEWWTASEYESDRFVAFGIGSNAGYDTSGVHYYMDYNGEFSNAYTRSMGSGDNVGNYHEDKRSTYSVRCVQDGGGKPPYSAERKKTFAERKKEDEQRQKDARVRLEKESVYFTDIRDGQKYRAVEINGDMWMAENLNYKTDSSWCYENADSNCVKYGRLYNWKTARTVCPDEWGLPYWWAWERLARAAGGSKSAGKALKAASGWNDYRGESGDGADAYGFSALSGGGRFPDGSFGGVGDHGHWWNDAGLYDSNSADAEIRHIYHGGDYMSRGVFTANHAFSVRCVRHISDGDVKRSDSAERKKKQEKRRADAEQRQKSAGERIAKISVYFTDPRDGRKYRAVEIGGKTWMAQNLNYKGPDDSHCYKNDTSNCEKYGRLYKWKAAKTACPAGWHLPARGEWDSLGLAISDDGWTDKNGHAVWDYVGRALKAVSGWNDDCFDKNGNGYDDYGFSALPGGRYSYFGGFVKAGDSGYWWTSTAGGGIYAYYRYIRNNDNSMYENDDDEGHAFSVRCVLDD